MKLQSVTIKDVGCIHELQLIPNLYLNVITGPNGVGKTTLLKTIAALLTYSGGMLVRRNANSAEGRIDGSIVKEDSVIEKSIRINNFMPKDNNVEYGFNEGKRVIYISDKRELEYMGLDSIPRDLTLNDWSYNDVIHSFNPKQIKGWFANRYLFSTTADGLPQHQLDNYNLAVTAFSLIDSTVRFRRVDNSSFDIMLETSFGEIYMEYLSSGYKSLIILILGIIKEIEFRFNTERLKAKDYDGVILIDEIDLHLHPTWQTQIINALVSLFPKAQFFITTHSPHVIQNLNPEQLIVLEKKDTGIQRRDLPQTEIGFRGWTVEEILRDIMGMESTETEYFRNLWRQYVEAIQSDDITKAKNTADELLKSLHPANELRKIIEIQLSSLSVE